MATRPDPDSLVLLKICREQVEAVSLRSFLESEGIEALVQGEHHRALEGPFLAAFIELRVMVRFGDLARAREVLAAMDHAEHLPAEPAEADPDDESLRRFRDRQLERVETARNPSRATLFAILIPFGGGHGYAQRRGVAMVLAAIQCLNLVLWLQGWSSLWISLVVVLFDAVFSGIAVRHDRERA